MNVTEAVVAYLSNNERVHYRSGRVYGSELPKREVRYMPRKVVVVMASGLGPTVGDSSDVPEVGNRFDVRCYGETPYDADLLHGAVYRAMKALARFEWGDVCLQVAEVGGGPLPGRDGDAAWPYTLGVYVVNAVYET